MPTFPLGGMAISGEPYLVPAPSRFGSSTSSLIPHGTKLTAINVDWDGDDQDYTANEGSRSLYPDYDTDYAYQHIHPNESNPVIVNQNDPRLTSQVAGSKALFFLKRPPATSGKQNFAGGFGLGGSKDHIPTLYSDISSSPPSIYRIWTYIQDHTIGSNTPIDTQKHMIKVPSGVGGSVEFLSDNHCPGDRGYRAYHNSTASSTNGYSMADWPYNPVTGDPWTWDDLEELQIGVYHATHNGNNTAVVYTMYLVVEHDTPRDPNLDFIGKNLVEWGVADDVPFFGQKKKIFFPWRDTLSAGLSQEANPYYNRWSVDPPYTISRTNTLTSDGQSTISGMGFSGVISYDYKIRYLNGEVVEGSNYRKFDETYPEVFVFSGATINPSDKFRHPFRGEIIKDADGAEFVFLTYPVLEWASEKFVTDWNFTSPLSEYPYIAYDLSTLYVIPLAAGDILNGYYPASSIQPTRDVSSIPQTSGFPGTPWTIDTAINAMNFKVDQNSHFDIFSPSGVANHQLSHPNQYVNEDFPQSRTNHDHYFRSPDLPSGSIYQTLFLTSLLGVPKEFIDAGVYSANMGLYQTTVDQAANDTGEGRFDFYSGDVEIGNLISGYTFGQDGVAGWHLNEATVVVPSGTRQVRFTFMAIRNTDNGQSPGGTLGGTSNLAAFDAPFFILNLSSGNVSREYHPADLNQDGIISSEDMAAYISAWQQGILPSGEGKKYLIQAEKIWSSGVSTHFADPSGGRYFNDNQSVSPENWVGSGNL
jgi:hypothetical protein